MTGYQTFGDYTTFRAPLRTIAVLALLIAFFTFVITILWSIKFDLERATATHCGVKNYLPSISAAIGSFVPQKYFWRIGIALHSGPRFLATAVYYWYYCSRLSKFDKNWLILIRLTSFVNVIELLSLIGLSYVSSTEHFEFHEKSFITFMISSEIHMLLSCYLFRKAQSRIPSRTEQKSLKWKQIFTAINITSFLLAVYFFFRHNWYCEPGVYTLFAGLEYIVVLTNIGFHGTAYLDFYSLEFITVPQKDKLS